MIRSWIPGGTYEQARDLRDLTTPHLKPQHVAGDLEARDGTWGFWISAPDEEYPDLGAEFFLTACGCTLVIEHDHPPCEECDRCEQHCECRCAQGHPVHAALECPVCGA